MRGPHNIWRLMRTGATFERTGAMADMLELMAAPPAVRLAARILGWPFKWLGLKGDINHPPMVRAITALGPAYVKFGQLMSTRPDVVGTDMSRELRVLQDNLAPFDMETAKTTIESALLCKLSDIYSDFSPPIAAASIAQVHPARLKETGEKVAVKVMRPNIERAFRRDIDAFYMVANLIEFLSPATRRLRPRDVVAHFDMTCQGELDLRMEASAASELAENSKNDAGFHVPAVKWTGTDKTVLTLEWVEGLGLNNLEEIRKQNVNMAELGTRIMQMFLRHALRDGYFHADMHQGNLKLMPNGDIAVLDFGITGRIDEYTRRVYADILMGFIRRDYKRVAQAHFEAGYVSRDQDVDEFAQALRSVGEPIFGQEADKISMARLLAHLFDVTERFGMETRLELILLQRTMVVVEGVARTLNPHLNIWTAAKPVVEEYIRNSLGIKAALNDALKTLSILSRFGPKLPEMIEDILINQTRDSQSVKKRRIKRRTVALWTGFGLMIGLVLGILVGRF